MRRRDILIGAAGLIAPANAAAAVDDSASTAIAAERASAAAEGKSLLIVFFASWCGWCQLMDRLLDDGRAGRVLRARFRIMHLRALERRPQMRQQQLNGADETFNAYAPTGAGLPFLVFVAADGHSLANTASMPDGTNIGFPVEPEELNAFDAMLRNAAPDITTGELATIRAACQRIYAP
jgi:thiol-disulfide isomerase/thioredoxin